MANKNKEIEVTIQESSEVVGDQKLAVHTLLIGKKAAGKVVEEGTKRYKVIIEGEQPQYVKSFDAGYEVIIRCWNLHQ